MKKISLECRVQTYKHLTDALENLITFREANSKVMSYKALRISINNEDFLNQHLTKIRSQIVELAVAYF